MSMDDGDEDQDDLNLSHEKFVRLLVRLQSDTPWSQRELLMTADYEIIKFLIKNPGVTINELLHQLNIRTLITKLLNKLRKENVVVIEGNKLFIHPEIVPPKDDKISESETKRTGIETKEESKKGLTQKSSHDKKRTMSSKKLLQQLVPDLSKSTQTNKRKKWLIEKKSEKQSPNTKSVDSDFDDIFNDTLEESIESVVADFDDSYITTQRKKGKDESILVIPPIIDILKDKGYFQQDETIETCARKPSYLLLLNILQFNPISTQDLKMETSIETDIQLELQRLQLDDLITKTNNEWMLSEEILFMLSNYVEQDRDQIDIEQSEQDILIIEKFLEYDDELFLQAMNELGFVVNPTGSIAEHMDIPEVDVMYTIVHEGPIKKEDINQISNKSPQKTLNDTIERLVNDELIEETNNQYEVAPKFKFLMAMDKLTGVLDTQMMTRMMKRFMKS